VTRAAALAISAVAAKLEAGTSEASRMMKKIHLATGLFMVVAFVLSGQYMGRVLPPFDGSIDGSRMMYRASHIYLMMAAVVNVTAGMYYQPLRARGAAWLQRGGSALVIVSQFFLLLAFVQEPAQNMLARPWTFAGCLSLLFGAFFVFLGWLYQLHRDRGASA